MSQASSSHTSGPDKVIRKLFENINEAREQYKREPLCFDKGLSFLAGEHACKMSIGDVPVGHDGFNHRLSATPMAIAFTENVIEIQNSIDPAHDILVNWISRRSSLSRILSSFSHTGIGAAESEDGRWFCCQILALFKPKLTNKDKLLIIGRYANKTRYRKELDLLSYSLYASAKLAELAKNNLDAYIGMTSSRAKILFGPSCQEAEYVMEKFSSGPDSFQNFLNSLHDNPNFQRIIRKDNITDIACYFKPIKHDSTACVIIFGKCDSPYRPTPISDQHYIHAAKCLQLVNDYRLAHNLHVLKLSHQWCRFADKYAERMKNKEIELDDQTVAKKLLKFQPKAKVHVGIFLVQKTRDPLKELLLIWSSRLKTRQRLLSENVTSFGFGLSVLDNRFCYAVRIIGREPDDVDPTGDPPKLDEKQPQYLCLTSDSDLEENKVSPYPSSTFRLTG
ncbi:hypothetical protein TRFO_19291 [Tritrichomonas foetus]|uniref:SCP domain-containing protein n=1 Tax=Tritrichomonas foetus TaxID=1144522 RepID=A0A1J4KNN6_9EUKA|nr:hypothetical protein TRFO_19291 [Tritrichomonas foetus]|eukprot:OHT11310.1 hypothetical protein TRFO_19291 [Tritrichomonas foetus]